MSSFISNCFPVLGILYFSTPNGFSESIIFSFLELIVCVLVFATFEDFDSVSPCVLRDEHLEVLMVDVFGRSMDGIGEVSIESLASIVSLRIFKPAKHV